MLFISLIILFLVKYLKAKYKYIIIDEFQDCGKEQFEIFIKLKDFGINSYCCW